MPPTPRSPSPCMAAGWQAVPVMPEFVPAAAAPATGPGAPQVV